MSAKIEMHNIDCMEYLATCEDNAFELAIVDPPYGINVADNNVYLNSRRGKRAKNGLRNKKKEWDKISKGLAQRVKALNFFIHDVYNGQKIFKDKIIPKSIILNSGNFRKECVGIKPPFNIWANICGSDLVRDINGEFLVLEDNLRVPSGVS